MDFIKEALAAMFSTPAETTGTILSLLGMCFTVMSFQAKNKKILLFIQTAGSILFFISYFFLGGIFGGIINSFYLVRNVIFLLIDSQKEPKKAKIACGILCSSYVITYVIYTLIVMPGLKDSILNLLPVLASIPGTIALTETRPVRLRLWKIPDSVFWMSYNIAVLSLGGILCEIFNLTSNTISIIRFRDKKPKDNEDNSKGPGHEI